MNATEYDRAANEQQNMNSKSNNKNAISACPRGILATISHSLIARGLTIKVTTMPNNLKLAALSMLMILYGCRTSEHKSVDPMSQYCQDPHIQPSAICYNIFMITSEFSKDHQEWEKIDSLVKCGISMKSSAVVNSAVGVYMLNTLKCDSINASRINKLAFISQADRDYNQQMIKMGCHDKPIPLIPVSIKIQQERK